MSLWWYFHDEQIGPIDQDELASLVRQQVVDGNTLVWSPGMPEWSPMCEVFELKTALLTPPPLPRPPPAPILERDHGAARQDQAPPKSPSNHSTTNDTLKRMIVETFDASSFAKHLETTMDELVPYLPAKEIAPRNPVDDVTDGAGTPVDAADAVDREGRKKQLNLVDYHLRQMGYDLLPYGAGVALAELMSDYSPVETASHIAHTTMARDVKEAGHDMKRLLAIHAHGSHLLDMLTEYKDDGQMRSECWKNDSRAVLRIITIDEQQQTWIEDILNDPRRGLF